MLKYLHVHMHILESFDNLVDLRDETRVRFRDVVPRIIFNAFHETVVNCNNATFNKTLDVEH